MSSHKQFYYMGSDGLYLFRLRQLMSLHHGALSLHYDSDTLYLIQKHLLQIKEIPISLDRMIQYRDALVPNHETL